MCAVSEISMPLLGSLDTLTTDLLTSGVLKLVRSVHDPVLAYEYISILTYRGRLTVILLEGPPFLGDRSIGLHNRRSSCRSRMKPLCTVDHGVVPWTPYCHRGRNLYRVYWKTIGAYDRGHRCPELPTVRKISVHGYISIAI